MFNLCIRSRFSSSAELSSEVRERYGVTISASTVRRRLVAAGLRARRPRKKPVLSTKMRVARLNFAKQHQNWSINDWKRVIFTDESKINLKKSET